MRILIANAFEQSGINGLKAIGCEVVYRPDLVDDALARALAADGAEVLIVRSTKVTEAMLSPRLKLIVRGGAGVNTIDVTAGTTHGVVVANCPGRNAVAVAELAFGLLLSIDRRIPDNVADLRAGKWNKKEYSKARGLFGATLGLLGIGHIAREVIKRAAAFGMPIVLWSRRFDGQDRHLSATEAEVLDLDLARHEVDIALAPAPAEVAAGCDVLSLALVLGPETRKIVNAEVLSRLKPGSVVINTARGEIVDNAALTAAIRERHLRVGLDVFAEEPTQSAGEFVDPIVREAGVYGTHHIGASTGQAQEAIAAEIVRIVQAFMETGKAPNAVN